MKCYLKEYIILLNKKIYHFNNVGNTAKSDKRS